MNNNVMKKDLRFDKGKGESRKDANRIRIWEVAERRRRSGSCTLSQGSNINVRLSFDRQMSEQNPDKAKRQSEFGKMLGDTVKRTKEIWESLKGSKEKVVAGKMDKR
ncbi:hypothetical protein RUM43_009754 [Polyplax serrata]|uniref:Uncharacterized protein n=1 Tax=Polyplax serrata TaxID=468196 RepID=A0AAN8RZV1_POLSC